MPEAADPSQAEAGMDLVPEPGKPRGSVLRNVLSSWGVHILVIVAGFVIPRMIDRFEGQELLGVWDFAWSLVGYVTLLSLGVVSAVNRYVARFTALADWRGLNIAVNSSLAILLVSFALGIIGGMALLLAVPALIHQADPGAISVAQRTVLFLTLGAALKLPVGVLEGVLTGNERYDLLNAIRGCREFLSMAVMVLMLYLGQGVAALASVFVLAEVLAALVKVIIVKRVCPPLLFSSSFVQRDSVREMLAFGGKTMLQGIARTGLYQLNNILVAYFLGPAVLAVYSRQRALVMHAMTFMKKYSYVFVPVSGHLDAQKDVDGLRKLLIESTRCGFYITLPIIAVLSILGDPLVWIWMGEDYRAPAVLAILALGHSLSLAQESSYSVLMGMNRHGLPSLLEVVAAASSASLCGAALGLFRGGMISVAICVSISVTAIGGTLVPIYACNLLRLSYLGYLRSVVLGPALAVVPFAGVLFAARVVWPDSPLWSLAVGLASGGVVLAAEYWFWVIPGSMRETVKMKVLGRFGGPRSRHSPVPEVRVREDAR